MACFGGATEPVFGLVCPAALLEESSKVEGSAWMTCFGGAAEPMFSFTYPSKSLKQLPKVIHGHWMAPACLLTQFVGGLLGALRSQATLNSAEDFLRISVRGQVFKNIPCY